MISRFLLFLSVVFLGFGQMAWGQYAGIGTFTKVTSEAELTDGYYVITNETDEFLMTNNRSGSATTGFFVSANSNVSGDQVINPSVDHVWLIETNGAGKTIYNEVIEKYAGWQSGNSSSIEDAPANSNRWTFSYASNKWTVNNVATPVRQLSYNPQDPRFAAYGNAGQHELQLYKMEASTDPTLTTNPASMSGFNYVLGSGPSSTQQLTLTGSNLEDDELVELTVLDNNFEIATSAAGPYSDFIENIELSPTSNTTTIYVRLKAGLSVGNYEDEIGIESTLLDDPIYVPLSGVVNAPTPTTTLSVSSLSGFTYVYENGPSTSQNFTVEGSNLTSNITVTAPTNYQVSLSSGTGYQNALTLTPVSGTVNTTTIYVRLNAGLAPNNYNGNITIATAGIANKTVALTGSVTCGVITSFPFTETFENSSPSRACWSQIQEDGSANWTYAAGSSGGNITTAQEGSLNARFVSQSGNLTPVTKLVSPVMDISGVTNPTVSFYYGQEFWNPDQNELKVYYRTSSMNAWVEIAHYTGNISSWTEEQLALPNPSATYQIAFEGINNFGRANVLDNVRVHSMVACEAPVSQPTNLVFSGITNNSISGSFTATTADKYLVIRSTSSTLSNNPVNGVVYTAGQALGNGTIVQSSSATTFTANGLSPETEYFFFVFAFNDTDCGGGPAYNVTSPLTSSETTIDGPCLEEDFNDSALPLGWLQSNVSWTEYSGGGSLNENNGYITTSVLSNPTQFKFDLLRTNNSNSKTLYVEISTTNQTTGFNIVATYTHDNTTPNGLTQVTVDLSTYSSYNQVWIRIRKSSGTASPWRFDNFEVFCIDSPNPAHTYFRSQANGDWTSAATWESSEDGLSWADATTYPGATAESVVIQTGNTVNINSSAVTITNTEVFGAIQVLDSNYGVDGDEDIELTIKSGGEFIVNGSGYKSSGTSFGLIETGGKVIARNIPEVSGAGSDFVERYLKAFEGLFYFADGGICEWDCTTTTLGTQGFSTIFAPFDTGDIAILRFTSAPPSDYTMGSGANTVFNAFLELTNGIEINISGSGQKTFVGGIRGEGIVDVYSTSGNINLGTTSVIPEMGGNILLRIPTAKLKLPNGANVTTDANFVIERSDNTAENGSIDRQGGILNINGTLDITNMRITNTASGGINVNNGGTIRTRHTRGLFGSNSAIVEEANLTLNEGSKVEYYATENQDISSGKEYYHLIFSGDGTKNPQNVTNVNTNGSILITGNPTVDYSGNNLGSTSGNSTDFTMDGGKLIIGTGGTQPRPGGIYNITGGAIEFTGSSQTDIRVSPEYHDVIISGQNITPGGKGFTIKNILSVTSTGEINIPSTPDTETPYVVTAQEGVQVEEGGQLTFENNANLMQDPGAANSGKISMLRKANVPSNQYNYWASPVSGQNLYEIYNVPNNRVMIYNTDDDYFTIKPNPHQSEFGIGYSIKGPVTNAPQIPSGSIEVVANFIGTPRNESLTGYENQIPLSDEGNHYNLIGNPFPSNLDLIALYNDSDNNTKFFDDGTEDTPTAYFWDNVSNTQMTQQGSNYNQSNYALLNLSSGIGTAAPCNSATCSGFGSGKKPNGIVKPGQGFIIRAAEDADHLTLKNEMRTTLIKRTSDDDEAVYFKTGNLSAEHNGERPRNDKFWVELVTADDLHIQAAVGYFTQAENSFERFDSKVMNEDASDNIYTLSEDDVKLSIQGRKGNFSNEDIIPLGVRFFKYGIHKIQLEETKGIFKEHQDIYVKDKYLNITHNLSANGPYLIDAQAGEFNDRFEIVFKPSLSSTVNPASPLNSLKIEKRDHQIEISSSVEKITEVEIFNLSGWSVYKAEQVNENILKIPASHFGKEIIIVNVQTESGKTETKKIINK